MDGAPAAYDYNTRTLNTRTRKSVSFCDFIHWSKFIWVRIISTVTKVQIQIYKIIKPTAAANSLWRKLLILNWMNVCRVLRILTRALLVTRCHFFGGRAAGRTYKRRCTRHALSGGGSFSFFSCQFRSMWPIIADISSFSGERSCAAASVRVRPEAARRKLRFSSTARVRL